MKPIAAAVCVASLLLSGCYLPDKYKADVTIQPDGAFQIAFDGEASMVLYVAEARHMSAEKRAREEANAANEAKRMVGKDGITAAEYLGDGRFKLSIHQEGTLAKTVDQNMFRIYKLPLDFATLQRDDAGRIVITNVQPKEKDIQQLKALGLSSKGDICVKTKAPVIEHNADSTPGVFSSCYAWKGFDLLSGGQFRIVLDIPAPPKTEQRTGQAW